MVKLFRSLVLLLTGLLAVLMLASCGGDDDTGTDEPVPVNFVSVDPPRGVEIAANAWITITFDNAPTDVWVTPGTATSFDKTVTVAGPFTPGPLTLTIRWADGIQTLKYTVSSPCCAAPYISDSTVKDGDMDVDPEIINSAGKIEIYFTEDVSGEITLLTQAGEDVGWIGKFEGNKATLELIKGREIRNRMIYIITGKVATAEGNESEIKILFGTKVKA